MKKGDKVVSLLTIKGNRDNLIKGDVYEIIGVEECTVGGLLDIHLKGHSLAWCLYFKGKKQFEKVDDQSMFISTEASRQLADLFKERDGCPETHPDEQKHLEEEKVFTTKEKF